VGITGEGGRKERIKKGISEKGKILNEEDAGLDLFSFPLSAEEESFPVRREKVAQGRVFKKK